MTVGVGSIAKIMAGECPYRVWKEMREPKKEEDDLHWKRWRENHDALVDLFVNV